MHDAFVVVVVLRRFEPLNVVGVVGRRLVLTGGFVGALLSLGSVHTLHMRLCALRSASGTLYVHAPASNAYSNGGICC